MQAYEEGAVDDEDETRARATDRLGNQFIRVIKLFERTAAGFGPGPGQDGIERAAYRLLAALVVGGPRRSGALAQLVYSDPSTVSRQVGALVRLGYLTRVPDPGDGRATLLAATPAGREAFERHRGRRNRHLGAITAGWTPAELDELSGLLARFASDVESYDPRLADPTLPAPDPHSRTKGTSA